MSSYQFGLIIISLIIGSTLLVLAAAVRYGVVPRIQAWREKRAAARRKREEARWTWLTYQSRWQRRIPNAQIDSRRETQQFHIPAAFRDMKGTQR